MNLSSQTRQEASTLLLEEGDVPKQTLWSEPQSFRYPLLRSQSSNLVIQALGAKPQAPNTMSLSFMVAKTIPRIVCDTPTSRTRSLNPLGKASRRVCSAKRKATLERNMQKTLCLHGPSNVVPYWALGKSPDHKTIASPKKDTVRSFCLQVYSCHLASGLWEQALAEGPAACLSISSTRFALSGEPKKRKWRFKYLESWAP